MNPNAQADLEDLFVYAQLVASTSEEAAELLVSAARARREGDSRPAVDLIKELSRNLPSADGGWLARRQVPAALSSMLPRIMVRLRPSRRMAIIQAFRDETADPSDRAVFLISVKRALESEGMHSVAQRLTPDSLDEAMRRYMAESMAPVPEGLEEALIEPGRLPERAGKSASRRRFPLPARIATGLLVILTASAIGTWITASTTADSSTRQELFNELSSTELSDEPDFRANNPAQIEQYISDRLNWRLSVPSLDSGRLVAVSLVNVGPLQLPRLHYEDPDHGAIHITVVDYRRLEQARTSFLIDRAILEHIAEDGQVDVRNAPGFFRVTWRLRDDVYVAVSESSIPDLRRRFRFE